jgi:ankyrin repeat protein
MAEYNRSQQLEGDQYSDTEGLTPHSDCVKLDDDLKLKIGKEELTRNEKEKINEKLVESLKIVESQSVDNKLKLEAYPDNHVLAQFALWAYEKNYDELTKNLSNCWASGWELLVTASSESNKYYGVAYLHPERQQVVIAHKGTDSSSDLWADFEGIIQNKHTSQINSAATFAEIIRSILHKLNSDSNKEKRKEKKKSLQLSFTGHSLGGWLAQITTFTVRYLIETNGYLQKSKEPKSCYYAHTVVFESPGCEDMLDDLDTAFDVRYTGHSISLNDLDITSYLSAPNLVNAVNKHVGILYRIFVFPLEAKEEVEEKEIVKFKSSDKSHCEISRIRHFKILNKIYDITKGIASKINDKAVSLLLKTPFFYTYLTHKMDNIMNVFASHADTTIGKRYQELEEVIDWPVITKYKILSNEVPKEYYPFFDFAKKENNFHPDPKEVPKISGYYLLRYQTKPVDITTHSISVFTKKEQLFLEIWLILEKNKIQSEEKSSIQKLDKEKLLNKFSIEPQNGEKIIRFNSQGQPASRFINFAKQLFRWHQEVFEEMNKMFKYPEYYKVIYSEKSKDYITLYLNPEFTQNKLKFNDSVGLKDFLGNNKQRVFHIDTMEDTRLEASRVYNILNQIKKEQGLESYTDENHYTFLNLGQLLLLRTILDIEGIFAFEESNIDNLLVIECQSHKKISEEIDFFTGLFKNFKTETFRKKIIIIAPQEKDFYEDVKSIYESKNKSLGDKVRYTLVDRIQFSSLLRESQIELLKKKVNIQGQEEQLVDNPDTLSTEELRAFNDMINLDTLIQLFKNKKGEPIVIGSKPPFLSNIEVAYTKIGKYILKKELVDALSAIPTTTTPPLFLISDIGEENIDVAKYEQIERLGIKDEERIIKIKAIIIVTDKESEFKQLCRDYPAKIIHWIKKEKDEFIWKQLYDPDFYVKRKFNQIVIKKNIKDILVKEKSSDLFVFSGIEQQALSKLLCVKEEEERFFNQNIKNKDIVVLKTSGKDAEAAFDEAKTKGEIEKPVYWIKVQDKKGNEDEKLLICHRSHGSLGKIKDHIDEEKKEPLEENEFSKVSDKAVIIIGVPGMGKSTTLTNLSMYKLESFWVIRIDLKDCQEAIKQLPSELRASEEVFKFLSKVKDTGLVNPLAKRIVQYKLENETHRPLLLLFDGFDEIKEESKKNEKEKKLKKKFIQLLKFLKDKTHAHLWVTTRKHYKNDLEEGLSAFATTFEPVSRPEQENFLRNFWMARLTLLSQDNKTENQEEKLRQFTEKLLKKAESILGKSSNFMGIPLQLRMLAEVFQSQFETIANSNDVKFEFHDTTGLYLKFIRQKYEIYFKEKTGLAAGFSGVSKEWFTELLNKRHRRMAFKELFNEEEVIKLIGPKSPLYLDEQGKLEPNEEQIEELYRVGLLQYTSSEGQVEFIHKTFAEYFTADLLISWLTKPADRYLNYPYLEKILFTCILIKSDCKYVRLFLNSKITVNQLSNEILRQFGERLDKLWSNEQKYFLNEMDQTALDIAALEGHTNIIDFLLGVFKGNFLIFLFKARGKREKTVLHLASRRGHDEVVTKLLNFVKDNFCDTLKNLVLAIDARRNNAVLLATRWGHDEVVTKLLNFVKDNFHDDTLRKLVLSKDERNQTALHVAICMDHDKMVTKLLNFVKDNFHGDTLKKLVLDVDDRNQTALHLATRWGRDEVVTQLLNFVKENLREFLKTLVLDVDDRNQTALHLATRWGRDEVVTQLLNFVKENLREFLKILVLAVDERNQTALHVATWMDHDKVVTKLLNFVKDNFHDDTLKKLVLAKNNQKQTALHLATSMGRDEVVTKLLNFVKDNFRDDTLKTLVLDVDEGNQTALDLATQKGYGKIADSLRNAEDFFRPQKRKKITKGPLYKIFKNF